MAGVKKDPNKTYSPNYGGRRTGQGRKKLYDGGRQQVAFSCSAAQKEALQAAAARENLTVSAYILQKLGL